MYIRRVIVSFLISIFIFYVCILNTKVYGQKTSTSGVAVYIEIKDKNVQDGDLISLSKQGYILAKTAYDPNIFGVVVAQPAVAFESNIPGSAATVSEGKVYMRVSTVNGNIKKGDLLTTSKIPGVAQKSTQSGFVAATALENYSSKSSDRIGKILVVLNVGLRSPILEDIKAGNITNITRVLDIIRDPSSLSPEMMMRLFFAGAMVVLSFLVAVLYFGRISSLGIEALGRNPLAHKTIVVGIAFNTVLAFGVIFTGIAIGYFVLVI